MSEVQWIKLKVGMFDDSKIKYIEALPDRDTIITIWVKLLTLAGKYNEQGYIMLSENLPYNEEMLANEFNRPLNSVRLAIQTFQKLGMVEDVGALRITNWEKHQSLDSKSRHLEKQRERQQRYRDRLKQKEENVTSRVTSCNGTEEELEEELELEEEVNTLSSNSTVYPYKNVIDYLNQKTGKHYKATTRKTKDLIKARCNEKFNEQDFKTVIDNKVTEWQGTSMEKYLRPETLFGTKFESYLNQEVNNNESNDNPYANLF
ncbi:phage replisome organizer N-terminal domain-containing protein [Staphylococcus saprophyticus]|uniref:phage replisome organizer N-terminal domain-containing protein n=1 Tax=Staphylococcus saprophyticus TaxID=29385 RepID=UPI0022EA7CE7|nr:phage replisome organizer N-terminal domain-containing protein [Staphylococcus saprophyticus]